MARHSCVTMRQPRMAPWLRKGRHAWLARPLAALLIMMLSVACANNSGGATIEGELRITGSTSMAPVINELSSDFMALHPGVHVVSVMGDSGMGVDDLIAGQSDLAALSWRSDATPLPDDIQAFPVARDGIAIVVHPENPVSSLTALQTRALFRGEILDWGAVGGSSEEPLIVSREQGSGTREAFESLVMGGDRVTLNALVMPGSQAVVDYVARHRAAVGYVTMAALAPQVKALQYEGTLPTAGALRSGAYHLERVLYLCAPTDPSPLAQAFVDFVLSARGQKLVDTHHVAIR